MIATPVARLILTGESGCGKSRACEAVAEALRRRRWDVAGVISPGVWEQGQKVAIDALDLRSGEVRRLAERAGAAAEATGPSTPGWHFRADTIAWCNSLLANTGAPDLLVVDELGPLEFGRNEGLVQGMQVADAGRFRMALLVVRPRLLPGARERWPEARVTVMRDLSELPAKVAEVLALCGVRGDSEGRPLPPGDPLRRQPRGRGGSRGGTR